MAQYARSALLSIDFGTSHTIAAVKRSDGRTQLLMFDGNVQLPSGVFLDETGTYSTGVDAQINGRRRPERFEPNPKQRIDDGSILLGTDEAEVATVFTTVLERVRTEASRTAGTLTATALTVPASWGPTRRHILLDAASAAGLPHPYVLPEPVSAALYFVEVAESAVPVGQAVVVFDLGAGTFDSTVLKRTEGGFDVVALEGRSNLGGLDFDEILTQYVLRRHTSLSGPGEIVDPRERLRLYEVVRQAKEQLSRQSYADISWSGFESDIHLTREELELVIADPVRKTIDVTQAVIRESGLSTEQFAGIFMVGGGSKIPLIAQELNRRTGILPVAIEEPQLAVAQGALVANSGVVPPGGQETTIAVEIGQSIPPSPPISAPPLNMVSPPTEVSIPLAGPPRSAARTGVVLAVVALVVVLLVGGTTALLMTFNEGDGSDGGLPGIDDTADESGGITVEEQGPLFVNPEDLCSIYDDSIAEDLPGFEELKTSAINSPDAEGMFTSGGCTVEIHMGQLIPLSVMVTTQVFNGDGYGTTVEGMLEAYRDESVYEIVGDGYDDRPWDDSVLATMDLGFGDISNYTFAWYHHLASATLIVTGPAIGQSRAEEFVVAFASHTYDAMLAES